MDLDTVTKRKIQVAVTDILRTADLDAVTEQDVRLSAAKTLGLDLSPLPHKLLVRRLVESFLLSSHGGDTAAPEHSPPRNSREDFCRVICKLSNKRDVAVRGSGEKTVVAIRELFLNDGKLVPSHKSISLSNDQWSIFRKSIPAIEEAITKVESRLRSEFDRQQGDDRHDKSKIESNQNGNTQNRPELMQKEGTHHRPTTGNGIQGPSTVASTPRGLVPIEIIRFDGKNYQQWADRMELYLNHVKLAYVLSDPCPSAVGVPDQELTHTLSGVEKWTNDDYICRQNILNSLCDNLFGHYSNKPGTAKVLWEELRLIYLCEEHGSKVSLVKKYIDFQLVEDKSVLEQVQEFHLIADSINAAGMHVEEKFHVNVILSKLPSSWKPFSTQLMKEDYLPVWMLMNYLKAEEESQRRGNKGEPLLPRPDGPIFQPSRKLGPQRIPMKRPGFPLPNSYDPDRERKVKFCTICKKKGHIPEQCWFRKPEDKNTTTENEHIAPANTVAGSKIAGAAE